MPRRSFAKYGLEARRLTLVHTPAIWASLESDAKDAGIGLPEYLDLLASTLHGMAWNLAMLRGHAGDLTAERANQLGVTQ
jgi:hypothetical protein